ncbi:response regulator transcription factor [Saccharothrix variisporea]|uniref:LuxR family transcriptional regulator n=1 Tax=Saccharothrix variisporea TaxID=543527 RepID=A0A495X6M2_9PSEU|nr:response regulator transcription factor [Saccharothrix variisporea]RKT67148.1 LuxR family transcriptional regulator [Saccharothrix variisporea]
MTDALAAARAAAERADTAWWHGRVEESLAGDADAFELFRGAGAGREAAGTALGLSYLHFLRGEQAAGGTWFARAERLLADEPDCVEHGFLRYVRDVEAALEAGDLDTAVTRARRLRQDARGYGDPNLVTVATAAEGRALVRLGRVAEGFALLDDAMAAALGGDLAPGWTGHVYCGLVDACHEVVDLRRMRAWTEVLRRWCESRTAVLFTGICRVHQAQLLHTSGEWAAAEALAARVADEVRDLAVGVAAEARYVVGESRRLRGDPDGAERAYLATHELGRDPQPGVALLRLAQHRPDVALASITAALTAADGPPLTRVDLLRAAVEIGVAAGAPDVARKSADELAETARTYGTDGLRAAADHARGAVLLADDHPEEALPVLRRACARWRELDVPHDCARVRLLLAATYDRLGDTDAADRERAAAHAADPEWAPPGSRPNPGGLTAREVDVLALVAQGRTNREVAAALVLSEKTVARHLANIYLKLGLPTRTAAAAYAFDHGLVGGSTHPRRR